MSRTVPLALVFPVICALATGMARADEETVAQAKALCEWSKSSHGPHQPAAPAFCSNAPLVDSLQLFNDMGSWWSAWRDANDDEGAKAEEEFGLWLQQYKHEQEMAARTASIRGRLGSMTPLELCREYYFAQLPIVRDEIKRRGLFSADEWDLIETHHVRVGMSEIALVCSWGEGTVHRTVTGNGSIEQHVYGEGPQQQYVYVRDHKVTAFQD